MNYDGTTQYYPTPDAFAAIVASKVPKTAKSILEPSAGKGSLIEAFRARFHSRQSTASFYACETSPELRTLLAAKGVPVLGNDFMQAEIGHYYFDAVMMNPPFAHGLQHLLRAWELLADGGRLVCVLNASSVDGGSPIRSVPTRARLLVRKLIAANKSEVTFHDAAFAFAENPTAVRVALVVIDKPAAKKKFTDVFEGMEDARDDYQQDNDQREGLMAYSQIRMLVDRYRRTLAAHAAMHNSHAKVMALCPVSLDEQERPKCPSYNDFANAVRRACWQKVFNETKLARYMTGKMRDEFQAFTVTQSNVEFSEANISTLLGNLVSQIESIRQKAVEQVFDKFTQYHDGNRCHIEGWKTNERWKVNKRVILPYMGEVDYSGDTVTMSFRGSELAGDIEKALCLLTGKDYEEVVRRWDDGNRYGGPSLYKALRRVEPGQWHDSEFFRAKLFKKGTLHIEFKTDELWRDFNVAACTGKNWLGG